MNQFFDDMNVEFQDFFNQHGFMPENEFQADEFVKSLFKIDNNSSFTVQFNKPLVKNNQTLNKIEIDKNNYIDAFYPPIWYNMTFEQRLTAMYFTFNACVKRYPALQDVKPQLIFDFNAPKNNIGAQILIGKKTYVTLSATNAYKDLFDSIQVLNTIFHEVEHCNQCKMYNEVVNRVNANNKRQISNINLSKYDFDLLTPFSSAEFIMCNQEILDEKFKRHVKEHLGKNNLEYKYAKYLDYVKNKDSWQLLLHLCYLSDVREVGAVNKASRLTNSAIKYYKQMYKNSVGYDFFYHAPNAKERALVVMSYINKKYNFQLKAEDIEEFKKLNSIIQNDVDMDRYGQYFVTNKSLFDNDLNNSALWKCFKKLMDIHKNKCVNEKISDEFVERFKNQKYKQ